MNRKAKIIGLTLFRLLGVYIVFSFVRAVASLYATVAVTQAAMKATESSGDTLKRLLRGEFNTEEAHPILDSVEATFDVFISSFILIADTAITLFNVSALALVGYLIIEFILYVIRDTKARKAKRAASVPIEYEI